MTTTVLDQVRQAVSAARQAGEPAPGRPTLVKLTGASDYQVRQALAELTANAGGDPGGGDPTGASAGNHAHQDGRGVVPTRQPADRMATSEDAGSPGLAGAGEPLANPTASTTSAVRVAGGQVGGWSGRLVAWTGFVFGSVMSVAANVLHTWLPATHEPAGWAPGVAPQIGAAVWPIGLLLSVEVLSRVRWHSGWLWGLARYGGAGTVAAGSAVISYGHLRDVLLAWGYGHPGAEVGPLVLDGLMVISGFALMAISHTPIGTLASTTSPVASTATAGASHSKPRPPTPDATPSTGDHPAALPPATPAGHQRE